MYRESAGLTGMQIRRKFPYLAQKYKALFIRKYSCPPPEGNSFYPC